MPGLRGMPAGIRTKSQPVRHLKQGGKSAVGWEGKNRSETRQKLKLKYLKSKNPLKRIPSKDFGQQNKNAKNTLFSFCGDGNDNNYITACNTVAPWWLRPQTPEGARSALTQPPSRSPSRHSSWRSENHRLKIDFSGAFAVSFREGSS